MLQGSTAAAATASEGIKAHKCPPQCLRCRRWKNLSISFQSFDLMKFAHAFQLAMNSKEILLCGLLLTCSCRHDGRTRIRLIRRAPRAPTHIAPLQAVRARYARGFQLSLKEFLLCDLVLAGRCRINVQRIHLDGSTRRIRLILLAPHAPNIGKVQAVRARHACGVLQVFIAKRS
jgi:hypothetical protein